MHATTKFLPDLFDGKATPIEQLGKLNTLLKENNCKVCVFIEDMDRNEEPRKAINSIAPLLNDFRTNDQISFIFTLGYNADSSDIVSRVTDYREDLFPIDITPELLAFVGYQHKSAYGNNIELFFENNPGSWLAIDAMHLSLNGMQTKSKDNIILLLNEVIATAREFSAIKREVESKWGWLQGEVNFDDLLIVTTLKVIDPIAYEFIFKNVNKLQGEHSEKIGRELDERWSELPASMGRSENRESSKKLICYVFNSWTADTRSIRPQSLSCKYSFKNFWEIYLRAGNIQTIDCSDQDIFNDMRDFNYNKNAESASFIGRMVGDAEFTRYVRDLWCCKKSNFDDDFWDRILDKVQTKSTSIHSSLITSSGREFEAVKARSQCETLKLIYSSYLDKESEQHRLHIVWALNASIYYFIYLGRELKNSSIFRIVFFQELIGNERFSKVIENIGEYSCKVEHMSGLFEIISLDCIEAHPDGGFNAVYCNDSDNKSYHLRLLSWILRVSDTEVKQVFYSNILEKNCPVEYGEGGGFVNRKIFDIGALELFSDNNMRDIHDFSRLNPKLSWVVQAIEGKQKQLGSDPG